MEILAVVSTFIAHTNARGSSLVGKTCCDHLLLGGGDLLIGERLSRWSITRGRERERRSRRRSPLSLDGRRRSRERDLKAVRVKEESLQYSKENPPRASPLARSAPLAIPASTALPLSRLRSARATTTTITTRAAFPVATRTALTLLTITTARPRIQELCEPNETNTQPILKCVI